MNIVFIIPTGIGCEIGGHAGDAAPAARLIAQCCDKLILHPNVVNAADINEMPVNSLYVEGSILDRFLEGQIELEEVKANKVLVVVNSPIHNETFNAISAARATLGLDASLLILDTPLVMEGRIEKGIATGNVTGWQELVKQVWHYEFDALALATPITVAEDVRNNYWANGGVNPWGAVEAKASRLIATELNTPVAHAPVEEMKDVKDTINEVVDPRMAAELASMCYLHCVLKGLHHAPRIGAGLSVDDVDCMITPYGCVGRPHQACLEAKIPIIAVKENKTALDDPIPEEFIVVKSYHEAAGVVMGMQAGITRESVRRPLEPTMVIKG